MLREPPDATSCNVNLKKFPGEDPRTPLLPKGGGGYSPSRTHPPLGPVALGLGLRLSSVPPTFHFSPPTLKLNENPAKKSNKVCVINFIHDSNRNPKKEKISRGKKTSV